MRVKILLIAIAAFYSSSLLYAQHEERLLYQDKKTIFSKLAGQEGRNINLTLQLYTKDKIRLMVNSSTHTGEENTPIEVHELNYLPIQNIIIQTLHKQGIGDGKSISDILESQSMSTINLMVLNAQIYMTSLNGVNRKDITSTFSFKTKIPIFIDADSINIDKLFKFVGYDLKKSKRGIKDTLTIINDSIRSISKKLQKLESSESNSMKENNKNEIKTTLNELVEEKNLIQLMIEKKPKKNKYLVGFAFVDKNEVVLDNSGYIRTIRITLADSLELRYRLGGYKISLNKFGIEKIQDYIVSLDIRSISASQKSLNRFIAIYKYLPKAASELDFWTHLSGVFQYEPPDDIDLTELFVPKKQRIIFNSRNPIVTKVEESDLNSVVRLNIFSDLIGIQEDQPNGLVQVEGTFRTHLFGWDLFPNRYIKNKSYILDHIEANLKFSKIENKLRYLDAETINGSNKITFIPNFQLLQYSNLEAGLKMSILKIESYKREFNLYGNLGVLRTGLSDTIYKVNTNNDTTKIPRNYNVLTFQKSLQADLRIKATSYMGIAISTEFIWLTLLDNDVKQSGGNFSRDKNTFLEFNPKQNVIINPQFKVYYLPNKDEGQRIYLRGAFFHDLRTKSNSYLTIQVGLSSDINKFLNFNKTKYL